MSKESAMTYTETKLASLLLGLLHNLGARTYRTKLVKVTYLIDEAYYRLHGKTITGLTYIGGNYGPNAESNEIVRMLDRLVYEGFVTEKVGYTPTGNLTYSYKVVDDFSADGLPLTESEWIEIQAAVRKYKRMNVKSITTESKNTEAFRRAEKFDVLRFSQDASLVLANDDIANDPFLRETVESIRKDDGSRISLETLRENIA